MGVLILRLSLFCSHIDSVDSGRISLDLRFNFSRLVSNLHWCTDEWLDLLLKLHHHRLWIVSLAYTIQESVPIDFLTAAEAPQSIVDI